MNGQQRIVKLTFELFLRMKYIELHDELLKILTEKGVQVDPTILRAIRGVLDSVLPNMFHPQAGGEIMYNEIFLLKRSHLLNYDSLPKYETLVQDQRLMSCSIQAESVPFTFVSHKWFSPDEPDDSSKTLFNFLRANGANEDYLWIDYCCMPQNIEWFSKLEFIRALDTIVGVASKVQTLTFDVDALYSSGWCFMENAIAGSSSFLYVNGKSIIEKEWRHQVLSLKFGEINDAPLIMLKSVEYSLLKGSIPILNRVVRTVRATMHLRNSIADLDEEYDTLLGRTYRKVVHERFATCFNIGSDQQVTIINKNLMQPRRSANPHELKIFQHLIRQPFCLSYLQPQDIFGASLTAPPPLDPSKIVTELEEAESSKTDPESGDTVLIRALRTMLQRNLVSLSMSEENNNPWVVFRRLNHLPLQEMMDDKTEVDKVWNQAFLSPFGQIEVLSIMTCLRDHPGELTSITTVRDSLGTHKLLNHEVTTASIMRLTTSTKCLLLLGKGMKPSDKLQRFQTEYIPPEQPAVFQGFSYDEFAEIYKLQMIPVQRFILLIVTVELFNIPMLDRFATEEPHHVLLSFLHSIRRPTESTQDVLLSKWDLIDKSWKAVFKGSSLLMKKLLHITVCLNLLAEVVDSRKNEDITQATLTMLEVNDPIFKTTNHLGMFSRSSVLNRYAREFDRQMLNIVEQSKSHAQNASPNNVFEALAALMLRAGAN